MTKQAVAVILKSPQGHYALQLRDDKSGIRSPGKWGLFGGEIEKDELPLSAAIREIREELGVELNPDRMRYCYKGYDGENGINVYIYKYDGFPLDENLQVGEGQRVEGYPSDVYLEWFGTGEGVVMAHHCAIMDDIGGRFK